MIYNTSKVLIVDDTEVNLRILSRILRPEYKIYQLIDGRDTVKAAEKIMPDLILLDILMPDMDGYEVFAELKKSEKTKKIPVIFITGLGESTDEQKGLALGAVDYIRKPFDNVVVKHRVSNQIKIITLQRELENALDAAETAAENAREAAAAAKAANEYKSIFLANMSHEVRTPMNAIMGITNILLQNENLSFDVKDDLGKIYTSCDMLLGIINDILDFSKIEAGKLDIIPSPYNIANLISDAAHLNMMRIGDKPIKFALNVEDYIPSELIGDGLRIKQVLSNLLSNAFKYTESGKVTMTVDVASGQDEDGITLILSVQDTGCGMNAEQLKKLFEEYSRFNEKSNRAIEGTGLGLAITYRLISLMNGKIHVESEPDKGTLVVVHLPQGVFDPTVLGNDVADSLRQLRWRDIRRAESGMFTRRPMPHGSVLIVDDIDMNRHVAAKLMGLYKLRTDTAISGREAIEKIAGGNVYDIIFMDHMMPEMDGIEATKHIRGMGYEKPIAALTANAVAGQADMFLQNGFDSFISKPIDMCQLDSILNKYIPYNQEPDATECSPPEQAAPVCHPKNIEIPGIDAKFGLSLYMDDMDIFLFALQSFAHNMPTVVEKLRGVSEQSLSLYATNIHAMKGNSASIGAGQLSEKACIIEDMAKSGDLSGVLKENEAFIKDAENLIANIKNWLPD